MNCSPPGSSVHGILQARILEWVGSHSLLQEIFLTQGLNPGLLHCRQILYSLNHQGRVGSKSNMAGVLIKGRETQKQMPRETAMR